MVHRFRSVGDDGNGDRELRVLCRWPDAAMPLGVYAATPEIPEILQSEFHRPPAALYMEGVFEALAMWERELEGLVGFRRVSSPNEADLEIRLLPEVAPDEHEKKVLGTIRLLGACRPSGWAADATGSAG